MSPRSVGFQPAARFKSQLLLDFTMSTNLLTNVLLLLFDWNNMPWTHHCGSLFAAL